MKRAILLLLGLLVPALALGASTPGKVLVICPNQAYGLATSSQVEDINQSFLVRRFMSHWKIQADFVPASLCNTWMVRRGTFKPNAVDSINYSAVVVLGFQVGRYTSNPAGFDPESLTLAVTAPQVPTILVGVNANPFDRTAACSTGVESYSLFSGTNDTLYCNAIIDGGTLAASTINFPWKAEKQSYSVTESSSPAPGTYRILVGRYASVAAALTTCLDCDTAKAAPYFGGPVLWYRDDYGPTQKRLIFCQPAFSGIASSPVKGGGMVLFAQAMAVADSNCGGAIFGTQTPPHRIAFIVRGAYKRRAPDGLATDYGIKGLRGLPADVVSFDSVATIGGFDSLETFSRRDRIPISVEVEVDSLDYYARDKSYTVDRLSNWKVFPGRSAGISGTTNSGNASQIHPYDLQGYSRSPSAFGSLGLTQGPESCYVWRGDTQQLRDTCIVCRFSFALNLLKGKFGREHVSPTFIPDNSDYASGTGFAAVGRDSFFSAMATGGISTFIVTTRQTSGVVATARSQFNAATRYRIPFGIHTGQILNIACDGHDNSTIGSGYKSIQVSEQYAQTYLDGIMLGLGDAEYQNAGWVTPEAKMAGPQNIVCIDVAHLGSNANTGRWNLWGLRSLKYVANPIAVMNQFGWRRYIVWDWPENVTTP